MTRIKQAIGRRLVVAGFRLLGADPGRVVAVTSPGFADPATRRDFLAWLALCPATERRLTAVG